MIIYTQYGGSMHNMHCYFRGLVFKYSSSGESMKKNKNKKIKKKSIKKSKKNVKKKVSKTKKKSKPVVKKKKALVKKKKTLVKKKPKKKTPKTLVKQKSKSTSKSNKKITKKKTNKAVNKKSTTTQLMTGYSIFNDTEKERQDAEIAEIKKNLEEKIDEIKEEDTISENVPIDIEETAPLSTEFLDETPGLKQEEEDELKLQEEQEKGQEQEDQNKI